MSESHSTNDEQWRSVVGYEGFYEVSNLGRVRRIDGFVGTRNPLILKTWKGRILKLQTVRKDGHLLARLCAKNVRSNVSVSRMVLEAFVGHCPDGMQACHDPDPTPTNNRLDNLRWDTAKANWEDMRRHGRAAIGERQGSAKLTEEQVRFIRDTCKPVRGYRGPTSAKNIAARFGVGVGAVLSIVHRKNWRHIV